MTCHQYVPLSRAMQNMQLYNTHSASRILIFSGIPASNKTTEAEGTAQFTGLLNIEISSQLHFNCYFREIYWSKLVTWLMVAVKFLFLKQDYICWTFFVSSNEYFKTLFPGNAWLDLFSETIEVDVLIVLLAVASDAGLRGAKVVSSKSPSKSSTKSPSKSTPKASTSTEELRSGVSEADDQEEDESGDLHAVGFLNSLADDGEARCLISCLVWRWLICVEKKLR